jgi:stearoyl-CoA desaturase (delta-9 desaturase)
MAQQSPRLSVRQGFRWWEYDPTFYARKFLSCFDVVWDLQNPPEASSEVNSAWAKVVEKVRASLPAHFDQTDRRTGPRDVDPHAALGVAAV